MTSESKNSASQPKFEYFTSLVHTAVEQHPGSGVFILDMPMGPHYLHAFNRMIIEAGDEVLTLGVSVNQKTSLREACVQYVVKRTSPMILHFGIQGAAIADRNGGGERPSGEEDSGSR